MAWLSFGDKRQERQWEVKFAADQAGLDAAVSLQTLLFPSLVARTLWDQLTSSRSSPVEVLWLAVFLGWALLHLLLAHWRPAAYLRYRTALVLLSRLQRQLTIMRYASLFHREAMGLAGAAAANGSSAAGVLPASLGGTLGMLLWRPGSIASLLSTYTLPLKYTAPCALLLLVTMLHSTLQQCGMECRSSGQGLVMQLYSGMARRVHEWVPTQTSAGTLSGNTCSAAISDGNPAWGGGDGGSSGSGSCGTGQCMGACVAVHAWLQLVFGALLPLAIMWAAEERSRLRFQHQWLQHHTPAEEEPAPFSPSRPGSPSSAGGDASSRGRRERAQRASAAVASGAAGRQCPAAAVPRWVLAAWLAGCSWAIWTLIELALL